MSGIVFFGTESPAEIVEFYTETIGMSVWLEQPDCTILRYDNMLIGFCERSDADTDGIVTFVYETKAAVDAVYDDLGERATDDPHENERYRIYQFFAEDPEGRTIEFQTFLHETEEI